MKYLVVMPEVAYITRYDGRGVIDSWDAPKGKFFKPMKAVEIPEEMEVPQVYQKVEILDSLKEILDKPETQV
jgi:hypothetical protein